MWPIRWSEDGAWIYAVDVGERAILGGVLFRIAPDGSRRERVHDIPAWYAVEDLSPDGQTVYLSREDLQADAWLVENPDYIGKR